jgi:endonuclease YncB( thermonuclease family)
VYNEIGDDMSFWVTLLLAVTQATTVNPSNIPDMPSGEKDAVLYAPIKDEVLTVERGDLIKTKRMGNVQLFSIYCPEKDEPLYDKARDFTKSLIMGKNVELEIEPSAPKDLNGNWRAVVWLVDDKGERHCINKEVVAEGYAKVIIFPMSAFNTALWLTAEKEAKHEKKGIWGLSPADFKKIKGIQDLRDKEGF